MRRIRANPWHGLLIVIGWVVLSWGSPLPALAGANCTEKPLTPEAVANAVRLGHRVFETLEQSPAQVALIGRVGADLSAYGLRFSHLGFIRRQAPSGRWSVLHLLNRCGTATSTLYDQGLVNFFLDDPFAYQAIIVLLDAKTQRLLVPTLQSALVWDLHQPHYNTIAHPRSLAFQNSNQWTLEILIAALAHGSVRSRAEAQQHPLFQRYQPDVIRIDRLKRIGGGLFHANLTFTDHPLTSRVKGDYEVVSVRSVLRFLEHTGHLQQLHTVDLNPDSPVQAPVAIEQL